MGACLKLECLCQKHNLFVHKLKLRGWYAPGPLGNVFAIGRSGGVCVFLGSFVCVAVRGVGCGHCIFRFPESLMTDWICCRPPKHILFLWVVFHIWRQEREVEKIEMLLTKECQMFWRRGGSFYHNTGSLPVVPYFWFEKAFEPSKILPTPDIWVSSDRSFKNIRIYISKDCLNCQTDRVVGCRNNRSE